ncbi:hypothetical protein N0V83_003653 [Neocucurbitaria cava]|uniref:Uncharacterized protein n=1 Tax=Neocucurbitaria cava TaxID=798079 RepID=A0A9W8YEF7_9PLEO|nr:hypothetical protein N0V83_003653 [Neocucurbitaria cava]
MAKHVLQQPAYRDKALYQPAAWYDFHGPLTAKSGLFMQPQPPWPLHPGHHSSYPPLRSRVRNMQAALGVIEYHGTEEGLDASTDHRTGYPRQDEVQKFWKAVAEARRVLSVAKDRGHTVEQGEWRDLVRRVKDAVELRAWATEELMWKVDVLKKALES